MSIHHPLHCDTGGKRVGPYPIPRRTPPKLLGYHSSPHESPGRMARWERIIVRAVRTHHTRLQALHYPNHDSGGHTLRHRHPSPARARRLPGQFHDPWQSEWCILQVISTTVWPHPPVSHIIMPGIGIPPYKRRGSHDTAANHTGHPPGDSRRHTGRVSGGHTIGHLRTTAHQM